MVETEQLTLGDLAEQYREAWDEQDKYQKLSDEAGSRRHELRIAILRRMEEEGLESFKNDHLTLTVKEDIAPQVKDWGVVFPWIFESGKLELLRKQLNSGPIKEMIENGEALPDGLEIVSIKTLNNRRR